VRGEGEDSGGIVARRLRTPNIGYDERFVCLFVATGPCTKLCAERGRGKVASEDVCYGIRRAAFYVLQRMCEKTCVQTGRMTRVVTDLGITERY